MEIDMTESIEDPDRAKRGFMEDMNHSRIRPGEYIIHNEDGEDYTVDIRALECTCPDFRTRNISKCKHLYRLLHLNGKLDKDDIQDLDLNE